MADTTTEQLALRFAKAVIAKGLVAPDRLDAEGISVDDISQRNTCLLLRVNGKGAWFCKVPRTAVGRASIDVERSVYGYFREIGVGNGVAPISGLIDEGIVLPFVEGPSLFEAVLASPASASTVAAFAELGQALARLHQVPTDPLRANLQQGLWVATLPSQTIWDFESASGATLQALEILCGSPLLQRLETVVSSWSQESLLHGDARLKNVIVRLPVERSSGPIALIDWESALLGPREWDVAFALGSLLTAWVHALPIGRTKDTLDRSIDESSLGIEHVRACASALVASYLAESRCHRSSSTVVSRLLQLLPIALLQAGFESCQSSAQLGKRAVLLLQLAENLLESSAAEALLAFEASVRVGE